ncbi:unnamed protein product [Medioppia subpectinata]|uniref:Cytochrome P450 n=1 Tax=Medioppia subpectinata TaxID=1979941 RepID=A0A7R9KV88_9ACAR|nr:unnamed protein product [Medioppia subpectinata]CAG2109114.1 unnamed protein product [Medioppia subpectinata]
MDHGLLNTIWMMMDVTSMLEFIKGIGVSVFRNSKKHFAVEIIKVSKVYGPVFTLWIGPIPFVFICNLDMARESFNKIDFTGRPLSQFGSIYCNEKYKDVVHCDYSKCWESLRRVSHTAIQKYAKTKVLSEVVDENVRQMVQQIIADNEGMGRPFSSHDYVYNVFANILASIVFSEKLDCEQAELKMIKYITSGFQTDLGNTLFLYEFIPVLRYLIANPLIKYKRYFEHLMDYTRNIYQKHDQTYDGNNLRDFCDILIAAKHEAIADDKRTAPYFTDDNLPAVLIDMVAAYYPNYQNKLRTEISREIGDRVPVVKDKCCLNYTMAFISEILRHRNPTPIGLFHKTMVNTKLAGHPIPENTKVVLNQNSILTDPKHWENADVFEPDRTKTAFYFQLVTLYLKTPRSY